MFCIDGFNDELSIYLEWHEYINLTRLPRPYERTQWKKYY